MALPFDESLVLQDSVFADIPFFVFIVIADHVKEMRSQARRSGLA